MKTLNVIVENAITYHEPGNVPAPVPTETTIPESLDNFVFFQVKNSEGKVLFQLLISEYFQMLGTIDNEVVISEHRNMSKQSKLKQDAMKHRLTKSP